MPAGLRRFKQRAQKKDPARRYQTAAALRDDLKRLTRDGDSHGSGSVRTVQSQRRWRTSIVATGGALLIFAAVLGYYLMRPAAAPPRILRTVQLTNTNRPKSDIVTDGSRVYFIEGQSLLSQTSVNGGDTFPVPNSLEDTGFSNVFDISPDGSALLMNTARGTSLDGPLWSVPVVGGSPRRLGNLEGHSGAWSPDGSKLIVGKENEIFVARNDGNDPRL